MTNSQNWINGQWIAGDADAWTSTNPFTGETLWSGNWASDSQCRAAVDAARGAFEKWSTSKLQNRIAIAEKFASILKERHEELARLITAENGKPLWEARTEVNACIGKVKNSIDALHERRWTTTEGSGDQISVVRYHPLGVLSVLGPFNFPAHLPGGHIIPALIAGNTVVFKPSEQTPAVGEFLMHVWQAAGLPNGVLNMVHGAAEVASSIAYAHDVNGVLFTGSYRVGKILHAGLAGQPEKMLALELGGNNALVVDSVKNIDAAVHEIILSAYITSGQRCTCARRLILTNSESAKRVLKRLIEVLPNVAVGDPTSDPGPLLGSLITAQAADDVLAAQSKWQTIATETLQAMHQPLADHPSVVSPGLLAVEDSCLTDHEVFGPLLLVEQATDLDDAIARANKTRYGLSAGLLSDDLDAFRHFVQHIRAGIVNWNRQTTGASGRLPFGGIGWSGNHQPSGFFAADYCSYPVSSLETHNLALPETPHAGLEELFPR